MTAPRLYHFTCDHGHAGILRSGGLIIPQMTHPICGWHVSWFTAEAEPDKFTTGLGAVHTTCDRMAHRWVIEPGAACRAWLFSGERLRTPEPFLQVMEDYGDPEHWWIADVPVAAAEDMTYVPAVTA
jgi:hypothetical protein